MRKHGHVTEVTLQQPEVANHRCMRRMLNKPSTRCLINWWQNGKPTAY